MNCISFCISNSTKTSGDKGKLCRLQANANNEFNFLLETISNSAKSLVEKC